MRCEFQKIPNQDGQTLKFKRAPRYHRTRILFNDRWEMEIRDRDLSPKKTVRMRQRIEYVARNFEYVARN